MKMNFDRFFLIDYSILSVNCSNLCIIYVKIYEKISSGGLEVSFSIVKQLLIHLISMTFRGGGSWQ